MICKHCVALLIRIRVKRLFSYGNFKKRGLCDIKMAVFDDVRQMPEEECQKKRQYMLTVNVGVRHDDDAVVPEFIGVERFCNPHSESDDERFKFFKFYNFVQSCPFGVENFTFERKDSLEFPVATLFGAAACGITLNDKKFRDRRILFLAVSEFPRK